jgi:NADPH:quinone reductase-like Zn-dependent oxidoreductase
MRQNFPNELVAVPAQDLLEVPAGGSEPKAAGAVLVYLTACPALTMWGLPRCSLRRPWDTGLWCSREAGKRATGV